MDNDELIRVVDDLRSYPKEQPWFEFKVGNTDPERILKTLSAIHNYIFHFDLPYGYIVYGIEDTTHAVVGTEIRCETWKIGNEEIVFHLSKKLHRSPVLKIFPIEYHGKHLVMFSIKNNAHEPIQANSQYWYRIGQNTVCLNTDRTDILRDLFNKAHLETSFEDQIAANDLSENDVFDLLDANTYYKFQGKGISMSSIQVIDDFIQKGFILRTGNNFCITNLGAILIAFDLKKFPNLDQRRLRVVKYNSINKTDDPIDYTGHKGYAAALGGAIDYVASIVPNEQQIENGQRVRVPVYPIKALREFIANALVHQDFKITGIRPTIAVYPNRIEITNAGIPELPTDRLIDENKARNEKLAEKMRDLKLCEMQGAGIDIALLAIGMNHLPAPKFIEKTSQFTVVLFAPQKFEEMDASDRTRICFQHCVLQWIVGEKMNNESLRKRLGLDDSKSSLVSKIISETLKSGQIKEFNPSTSYKFKSYVPSWSN